MKHLLVAIGFAFLLAASAFASEESLLARITVYWPGEGQLRACSNGARLRAGHCAVDPKRIPFGSRVRFPDADCIAVDSGPAVVSRKAARVIGRTASQRNALVIDRFFESKEAALSWESRRFHRRSFASGAGHGLLGQWRTRRGSLHPPAQIGDRIAFASRSLRSRSKKNSLWQSSRSS